MTEERDQIRAALAEAGLPTEGPYYEDAVETWERQQGAGKKMWPVEIFVKLAEHRQAGVVDDRELQRNLEREIHHLQGGKGDPWLSDEERAAARAAVRRHVRERERKQPMKILMAEDDPQLREATRRVLVRMGHEVFVTCDGKEALEATLTGTFDLIVSDLEMPRMSGIELHDALPEHLQGRFLLHSGNPTALAQVKDRMRTLSKGGPPSELRHAVEEILSSGGDPG